MSLQQLPTANCNRQDDTTYYLHLPFPPHPTLNHYLVSLCILLCEQKMNKKEVQTLNALLMDSFIAMLFFL